MVYVCDVYADHGIDEDSKTFVGCYIDHNDKHRTRSAEGPEPEWNHTLRWYVHMVSVHTYLQ